MGAKHIVVHGATVKCQFSVEPKTDTLQVLSHKKHYANDREGETKLMATTKEIGQTLKKNTFGKCKKQPTSSDFLPCQAVITKWSGFYEKMTLSNQGKILIETSKATCPMGAQDCISIDKHGQKAKPSKQQNRNSNDAAMAMVNPLADNKKLKQEIEQDNNFEIE
jgi:Domain of unknown function (DUF4280)